MRLLSRLLVFVWGVAIVSGLARLWRYESTPGPVVTPPTQWPAACGLIRRPDRATLVMLAHPRCPCTRASLRELAQVMAHRARPLTAYVIFYKPKNASLDWEKTSLYHQAAAIPGVTVVSDVDGTQARQF